MKIEVKIEEMVFDTETGERSGLEVTCPRCDSTVVVFGVGGSSARAGAMKLKDECPIGENNYYDVSEWVRWNP